MNKLKEGSIKSDLKKPHSYKFYVLGASVGVMIIKLD